MKHLKWLYGAIALTLLGACADRDFISDSEASQNGNTGDAGTVSGYIAVEIKLPQDVPTRAEDEGAKNDQYADGTPEEYKVHNALIALFKGNTEDEAIFYRAQDLQKPFFSNLPEDDPVSASYIAAIPVQKAPEETETLWALVVLNRNGDTTSITTNEDGKTTLTLATNEMVSGETSFAAIKNYITDNSFIGADKKSEFFMINAPMSTKPAGEAGAGDITYLTNLGNQIYDTPEEAKENVSGCVYVERAVAKVTCRGLEGDALNLQFYDENGDKIDMAAEGWTVSAAVRYALSNTSNKSYLLRNTDFSDDNHFAWNLTAANGRQRMIGTTGIPGLSNPFHDKAKNLYRTYWCKDPHYGKAMVVGDKFVVKNSATDFTDYTNPIYCKENTFQVQHMNYNSSTLAIFEVDFSITKTGVDPITDLYVRDGNTSKIYLTPQSAYADGITRIIKDLGVQEAIKKAVVSGKTLPGDFSVKDHLDIKLIDEKDAKSGEYYLVIKDVKLKVSNADKTAGYFDDNSAANFDTALASSKNTLLDGVNALSDIIVYKGGKCYYTSPIKHFGDYYTPCNKSDIKGVTTEDVYNNGNKWDNPSQDHAKKYLGRYGVVRNNWYELNISKIAALGSSVIPDSNITLSDDNNEDKKYFAVEIHLLSWAKRLQNMEF